MEKKRDNEKWHLIRNDNGEWISDEYAVFVSNMEAGVLKVQAARQNKPLHVQHGPNGSLWCYKHEVEAIDYTSKNTETKYRVLRITKSEQFKLIGDMEDGESFRGKFLSADFADKFKGSRFYKDIYDQHKDEIIIGVRDGFINLYYNCDSIAKINASNPNKCIIARYYIDGGEGFVTLSDDELVSYFDTIKAKSNKRNKYEKQAQQRLYLDNNNNSESKWFCIDVEYTKSLHGKLEDWRFDIIAVSKESPFRVALIELKYGAGALGGNSGIRKHIKDFYSFFKNKKFEILKPEIVSIMNTLQLLGVKVPNVLRNIEIGDIAPEPEFYFITLNNNPENSSGNTPKQTMNGYLFSDKRWNCNRVTSLHKTEGDFFGLTEHNTAFRPVFLFSEATLPNIQINDILDRRFYDVETVNQ